MSLTAATAIKLFLSLGLLFILSACTGARAVVVIPGSHAVTPSATTPPAPATPLSGLFATLSPSVTPLPTTEPPRSFETDVLRGTVYPTQYIADLCRYYALRWDPERSRPGTVVAPIMFHRIAETGDVVTNGADIDYATFERIVDKAIELGFESITSEQLLGFLLENERIPQRSMMLILDDRRPGTAEDYFLPILQENDWTATLAWPIGDTDARLWEEIEAIHASGYFDVQSHGLNHIYLNDMMSEEAVREEIGGSIPILEEHFGQRPLIYVWPGGNFTDLGLEIAHEVGFELGFIERSYGPLLFNWVPQTERELPFDDPLFLLPRFWSSAAIFNLEQTAAISEAAQAFAEANYPAEAAWYAANCGGQLPPRSP